MNIGHNRMGYSEEITRNASSNSETGSEKVKLISNKSLITTRGLRRSEAVGFS